MIYINDTTRISRADDMNLQIEVLEDSVSKRTKEVTQQWNRVGYYSDLKGAINGVLRKRLFNSVDEEAELRAMVDKINECYEKLRSELAELGLLCEAEYTWNDKKEVIE